MQVTRRRIHDILHRVVLRNNGQLAASPAEAREILAELHSLRESVASLQEGQLAHAVGIDSVVQTGQATLATAMHGLEQNARKGLVKPKSGRSPQYQRTPASGPKLSKAAQKRVKARLKSDLADRQREPLPPQVSSHSECLFA